MKREDIEFKKKCQKYHDSVRRLLKQGKIKESDDLINKIGDYLRQWRDFQRSVHIKVNALKFLYAAVAVEQRKTAGKIIKAGGDGKHDQG